MVRSNAIEFDLKTKLKLLQEHSRSGLAGRPNTIKSGLILGLPPQQNPMLLGMVSPPNPILLGQFGQHLGLAWYQTQGYLVLLGCQTQNS
jgi:hypothetical protein